jgi:D-cysteine desulfhydrase family pyridoxal phosphate-dependent enzyme
MEQDEIHHAITRLGAIPHLNYGDYPTPIEEAPRLRAALGGGPRLLIKRDDYTGAGFGGNKVRKLEYALARAAAEGVEAVITTGGEKSNHARVTAALCARMGLRCILVLSPAEPAPESSTLKPASLYLDEIFGAEIHRVRCREERKPTASAIAGNMRREGVRVAEVPLGASSPLGALGFVRGVQEAAAQFEALDARPQYIFHAASSGGTQAGIIVGCQLFGLGDTQVVSVSADETAEALSAQMAETVNGVVELLGLAPSNFRPKSLILDSYIGPGYGLDTPESVEALRLLGRTEGVILDPIYTAKAMAALLDWVRKGRLTEKDTVLFWHTGGQLTMFYAPHDLP